MMRFFLSPRKQALTITEIVTDKDSSMNVVYCHHFPESTIMYCSNHSAKTMHKDLQKVKQLKFMVSKLTNYMKAETPKYNSPQASSTFMPIFVWMITALPVVTTTRYIYRV